MISFNTNNALYRSGSGVIVISNSDVVFNRNGIGRGGAGETRSHANNRFANDTEAFPPVPVPPSPTNPSGQK